MAISLISLIQIRIIRDSEIHCKNLYSLNNYCKRIFFFLVTNFVSKGFLNIKKNIKLEIKLL
jgi:hypothetical protein